MLVNLNITDFLNELASDSPAPGGGSVAALSGALSAGLVAMVCRLTAGKKGLEEYADLMKSVQDKAEAARQTLQELIDLDTEAFNQVMGAFKMPKATDQEKSARSAAIQAAYRQAVEVPFRTAQSCGALLNLALEIADAANPNCISDLGVAGQSAMAGLRGAMMNVQINLPSLKDGDFVERITTETKNIASTAEATYLQLDQIVGRRLVS